MITLSSFQQRLEVHQARHLPLPDEVQSLALQFRQAARVFACRDPLERVLPESPRHGAYHQTYYLPEIATGVCPL